MSEDQPMPSPRTGLEPMAFTRDELLSGAIRSWWLFVGLLFCGIMIMFAALSRGDFASSWAFGLVIGGYMVLIAAGVSAFATAALTPVAWLISRGLRRQHRLFVHALIWVLLGVATGGLAAAAAWFLSGEAFLWLALIAGIAACIAVPLGWALTVRDARRQDQGFVPRRRMRRVDPDMLAEDALTAP